MTAVLICSVQEGQRVAVWCLCWGMGVAR